MRDRWRLPAAVLAIGVAGALAVVASSHAAITITSLQARASGSSITSGPMGAGYDIRIVANVTGSTTWRATSWTSGGVTRCVDHSDQGTGTQTVVLEYEFESNQHLREVPPSDFPEPGKVGPSEHVFPPPSGPSQLRVQLYSNETCTGTALASQSLTLTTVAPGTNEPLLASCQGMKVALVLDESGSIASAGATQEVRDATRALAQGLVDTGAVMAVFKFSTRASSDYIGPYQNVTQSFINGRLDDYLDRYDPEGSTNWDAGLTQVRDRTALNRPDLVVFLTDGNPNRRGDGDNGYEEGYYTPVNDAVDVADEIKRNSHMFAIGVGQGVTDSLSALRIQAVSGTKSFPEYSIETADYTLITDFTELEEALADLASNLCNVTVTVKKETDELVRDAWVSKPGWGFSGRVELRPPASAFAYRWYEPGTAGPPVNTSTATQSGNTVIDGTIDFVWRPTSAASLSNITISDAARAGYEPESVTCTSGGTTILDSDVPAIVASFTLQSLRVRDHVSCVVRNRFKRSTVRVVKNWEGDPSSATIFVDANGTAPYDASRVATASGQSTSFDYPVSSAVTVGETSVPAGYAATIDCGQGAQAYGGGPFPVTAPPDDGGTRTCTITNRQLRSTVQVVKHWVGAPSSATIFVDRTGSAPFDASIVATAGGDSTSFSYPVSTPVTVGETALPAGFEATIQCGTAAAQPYAGGPFPVTSPAVDGATVTCTITNIRETSSVRVVKNWAGAASAATIFVDQDGTAPFDASTVATATGDSAAFTYPISTPAFVGETAVPAGYSASIRCGTGTPQPYAGGPFPVTSPAIGGATLTCVITNTQQLSAVRVVKQWTGAPSSATIFVDQDGAAPFDASTVATASGDSASFTYPVSTPVFVGETAVPAGYAATIQCGTAAEQPYAGGPFPVTSPAVDGATISCTITNTQQLSKVRVVKNWSGAASTATIFVDQDGVAPFDASTVATADGDNTFFTYPVSTPAFVGEVAVPAGYTATIQCGAGAPVAYAGGPFAVTSPATNGATLTCTISNNLIPPPATVRVVKEWIGPTSSTTIFVDADGTAPFDASTVATTNGASASFEYTAATPVTVGETAVPTGYDATIQCGDDPAQAYQGGPFAVVAPAAGATLTCTITNRQLLSTVRVVKQWVGAPSSAEIFVDEDGAAPYDASTIATATGATTFFTYPVSTPVFAGETTVPAGYEATISCGELQGRQDYAGGPFPVTSPASHGQTLTCTITNTQQLSYVRTVKHWVGAPSSAEIFVDATGVAPYDASMIATASGDDVFFQYPVSTPVTAGETTVPAGYGARISCGALQARQAYNGGPFPVVSPAAHGAVVTCTVTNTQLFSTVRVVKRWIGAPASAEIFVDATGAPPFDASTVATADGDSASFDYPVSTAVTVGETTVPAGYAATIDCGSGAEPYTGGPFQVTSPADGDEILTCTITNRQLLSTVQVVKEWAGATSAATIFVDVNGTAPYDASTVATASGHTASFEYPVSTPVTVGETNVPSGFTAAIDCGGGQQAYAGGPFPVTSPAADGATVTCTITNSPVTTVRLLKEWAGPARSATIFVDEAGRVPLDVASVATADGQSVSFDYPPSTQVTIGEIRVPLGYRAFVNCGTGPRDLRLYQGGPFTVTSPSTPGGVLTCTVTNAKRLGPLARLGLTKTADRRVVRPSQRVRFRIAVRNRGRGTARSVTVCDRMPRGLRVIQAQGARRVGRDVCWRLRSMRPGAGRTFQLLARVTASYRGRRIVNPADVSGQNSINCRRQDASSRLPACRDQARLVLRGGGALPARRVLVRPPFTG